MDEMPHGEPGEPESREGPIGGNARYAVFGGVALALVAIAVVALSGGWGSASPAPVPTPTSAVAVPPTPVPTATLVPTPTAVPTNTPVPVKFSSVFDFQPLAIMVENHSDARPQSGLDKADVVYEAVVEAGITRFMAVYANREAEVVGPVRSARHYYVYWACEYNAIYAHCGSSPQGYDALRAVGLTSLDDTYGTGSFWRSNDRVAPHNLYASTRALRDSAEDWGSGWLSGLRFRPTDAAAEKPEVTEIRIVHPDQYTVVYTYSKEDNAYLREMEGFPHVDAYSGVQYQPKNVIVEFVEAWRIPGDTAGRMDMALVGQGDAYVFVGGKAIKGSWIKPSLTAPTHYVDASGNDIVLNPGQTWIQVVPDGGQITYH